MAHNALVMSVVTHTHTYTHTTPRMGATEDEMAHNALVMLEEQILMEGPVRPVSCMCMCMCM